MKGSGIIVELQDGRRGIVFRTENLKTSNGSTGWAGLIVARTSSEVITEDYKVIVRLCDENNNPLKEERGLLSNVKNLKPIGYIN